MSGGIFYIMCDLFRCVGMAPESSKSIVPGAARDASSSRSDKSCLGACGVGTVVGSALRCHMQHSGCYRSLLGNSHKFPGVALRMRASDGAMCLTGATVLCVYSISDVLGRGAVSRLVWRVLWLLQSLPSPGIYSCPASLCGWFLLGRGHAYG